MQIAPSFRGVKGSFLPVRVLKICKLMDDPSSLYGIWGLLCKFTSIIAAFWSGPLLRNTTNLEMNFATPHQDLRESIAALEAAGKLVRVRRAINKDTELHPLVRWQFRGLKEDQRKAFLFENVVDSKGKKYESPVLVGGLAASAEIYCMGLKCAPDEVADRWLYAMDHPIAPEIVGYGPVMEEIHAGAELMSKGGFHEFPIPISTPGFDNGPYITAGHWITKDPETKKRNVGNYRGLIKGSDRSGLMSGTPQDLTRHWEKCRQRGIPLEVAVAVGTVPAVSFAATQKVPPEMDEL